MSRVDEMRPYYVYKYVFDPIEDTYTAIEGEIQWVGKAVNSFDAMDRSGCNDANMYDAREMSPANLDTINKGIAAERKHLSKLSKGLKALTDERDAEIEKFKKDRPCPNGCGKMDEKNRCKICGFGYEDVAKAKDILPKLDEALKELDPVKNAKEIEALKDVQKGMKAILEESDYTPPEPGDDEDEV